MHTLRRKRTPWRRQETDITAHSPVYGEEAILILNGAVLHQKLSGVMDSGLEMPHIYS